jgi:hypothetical protein
MDPLALVADRRDVGRMQAPDLLDRLLAAVRATPPRGLAANDVDAFVHRNRAVLLALIAERLADREPDLWTPAKRTKANLAAMEVLAHGVASADDQRILARYSGWVESVYDPDPVDDAFRSGLIWTNRASHALLAGDARRSFACTERALGTSHVIWSANRVLALLGVERLEEAAAEASTLAPLLFRLHHSVIDVAGLEATVLLARLDEPEPVLDVVLERATAPVYPPFQTALRRLAEGASARCPARPFPGFARRTPS